MNADSYLCRKSDMMACGYEGELSCHQILFAAKINQREIKNLSSLRNAYLEKVDIQRTEKLPKSCYITGEELSSGYGIKFEKV
ncbi:MAG: hypothetical protein H0T62_12450 [Parachlamydiaceae bacterium]|nr:hypothetical protein [Parachlamydiaceae bacterium]